MYSIISNLFKKKTDLKPVSSSSLYSSAANKSSAAPKPYSSQSTKSNATTYATGAYTPATQIQGSGMTTKYANNPTNQPKPAAAPPTTAPQPQGYTAPQPQQPDYNSSIDKDRDMRLQLANEIKSDYQKRYDEGNQLQDDMLKQTIGDLLGMKGGAQSQFDEFASSTRAGVENLKGSAERQKQMAQDYYGEAQRKAASARRDTQADAGRRFAALNTVDSFGEGSYGRAQENIDSEFNSMTAKYAQEAANKMADIDDRLFTAQEQAESSIRQEQMKLQETFRQIDSQIGQNTLQNRAAKQQAYERFQDSIFSVKESMMNIQTAAEEQKRELARQMEELRATQFSPEFMSTGVPTNQKEYEYLIKNQEAFSDLYGFGADAQQGAQQKPMSGDTAKLVGLSKSGIESIAAIRKKVEDDAIGVTSGITDRNYAFHTSNLTDTIGRLRSGGAIGAEEAQNLAKLVPSWMDDKATRLTKLSQLEDEFNDILNGIGNSSSAGNAGDIDPAVAQFLQSQGLR